MKRPKTPPRARVEKKFSKLLQKGDRWRAAKRVEKKLSKLLRKLGYPELFQRTVVPDMVDAFLNGDPAPLWWWEGYRPPTVQDDPQDEDLQAIKRAWDARVRSGT